MPTEINYDILAIPTATQPGELPESTYGKDFYVGDRGLFTDLTSALGRGSARVLEMGGHAYETMTGEDTGLDEWARKQREERKFLQPDIREYYDKEGWIKKSFMGAAESAPLSLSPLIAGIAGTLLAGPIAGGTAAIGTMATLFGAGTYGSKLKEGLANNLSQEEAESYARKSALTEVGIEAIALPLELMTGGVVGSLFKTAAKGGIKGAIKQLTETSAKGVGLAMLKTGAIEVPTEMVQSGLEAQWMQDFEIEGAQDIGTAALDSIGPSIIMSMAFGGIGQSISHFRKRTLKNKLKSENALIRLEGFTEVSDILSKKDPELAKIWDDSIKIVSEKGPVNFNEELITAAEDIERVYQETPISISKEDILSTDPDKMEEVKTSVDKQLSDVGKSHRPLRVPKEEVKKEEVLVPKPREAPTTLTAGAIQRQPELERRVFEKELTAQEAAREVPTIVAKEPVQAITEFQEAVKPAPVIGERVNPQQIKAQTAMDRFYEGLITKEKALKEVTAALNNLTPEQEASIKLEDIHTKLGTTEPSFISEKVTDERVTAVINHGVTQKINTAKALEAKGHLEVAAKELSIARKNADIILKEFPETKIGIDALFPTPKKDLVTKAPIIPEAIKKPVKKPTVAPKATWSPDFQILKDKMVESFGTDTMDTTVVKTKGKKEFTVIYKAGDKTFTGVGLTAKKAAGQAQQQIQEEIFPAGVPRKKTKGATDIRTPKERQADLKLISEIKTADDIVRVAGELNGYDSLLGKISSYLKGIAGKKQMGDIGIEIAPGVKSFYNHKAHKITIGMGINVYGKQKASEIMLHELDHALTVNKYKQGGWFATRMGELFQEARSNLSSDELTLLKNWTPQKVNKNLKGFNKDLNFYSGDVYYGLLNEYEFMAQMTTNKDFQDFLKSIKVDKPTNKIKTLWDKFIAMMGKVFGLNPDEYTLLSEALTIQEQLIKSEFKEVTSKVEEVSPAMTEEQKINLVKEGMVDTSSKKETIKEFFKDSGRLIKDIGMPISNRLRNIHTKLRVMLLKMESKINRSNMNDYKSTEPFIKAYERLDKGKKAEVFYALNNRKLDKAKEILNDDKAFASLQKVLKRIEKEAELLGLIVNKIDGYFPRKVKDIDGLTEWFRKRAEEEAKKEGKELTRGEVAELEDISKQLKTGVFQNLPRAGSTKERSIINVHPDAMRFYEEPVTALIDHIYTMNTQIASDTLVGATRRQRLVKQIRRIDKMEDKATKEDLLLRDQAANQLADKDKILEDSIADTISTYVKDKGEQREAIEMIRERLKERGMHGPVSKFRNVGLMFALGNISSAVTQLADPVFSIYESGLGNTVGAIGDYLKTDKGKKLVDLFDLNQQAKEFATGGTTKYLDKVLTLSGLKMTDLFGKGVFLRAKQRNILKQGEEVFVKEFKDFGKERELQSAYKAFKNDTIHENELAQDILFAELSEYQPISLSEMPKKYLGAGNLRIFWMLKSFAIKALNATLNEAHTEFKQKNYKKGIQKSLALISLLSLAGAGTDEIKDFLMGREKDLSDSVIDSFLQLMMLNRYSLERGFKSENILNSLISGQLPPIRFADDFLSDVVHLAQGEVSYKSMKYVPMFGRQTYARLTPQGKEKELKMAKKDVASLDKAREINRKINTFNRGKKKEDKISKINLSSLRKRLREE